MFRSEFSFDRHIHKIQPEQLFTRGPSLGRAVADSGGDALRMFSPRDDGTVLTDEDQGRRSVLTDEDRGRLSALTDADRGRRSVLTDGDRGLSTVLLSSRGENILSRRPSERDD